MAIGVAVTLTIGAALTGAFFPTTGSVERQIRKIGKEIDDLNARKKEASAAALLGKHGDAGHYEREVARIGANIERLTEKQERFRRSSELMAAGKEQAKSAAKSLAVVGASILAISQPIRDAASFEASMLGVAKQMDGARDSSGKLTPAFYEMQKSIQMMGREIPLPTAELADMTTAGLRMGVAKEEVLGFVKTSAMMATAFDLPAGQLAEQMGKVAGLFNVPITKLDELGDVINYLDDNAKSEGKDIIEVLKRIGGTAATLHMPAKEAAALGSTFLTLGASAEVAATASNAVMRELSVAESQPARFKKGLAAIGMDAKAVQEGMAKDATGTILKVLDAINSLPEEQRMTVATQLFGKEYGDDVAKLAIGGAKEYRRQLQLVNDERAKGSMSREFEAKKDTTLAQWQMLKNTMFELSVNIGQHVLPAVNELMGNARDFFGWAASWMGEHGLFSKAFFGTAGSLSLAAVVAKVASVFIGLGKYLKGGADIRLTGYLESAWQGVRRLSSKIVKGARWMGSAFLKGCAAIKQGVIWLGGVPGKMLRAFGQSIRWLGRVASDGLAAAGRAIKWLASGTGKALTIIGRGLVWLRTAGMALLTNPLFLALGLLAGAAYLIYRNWTPIKQFFSELSESTSMAINDWIDAAVAKFDEFRTWIGGWVDAGVKAFDMFRQGVGQVIDWVMARVDQAIGKIRHLVDVVGEQVAAVKGAYQGSVDWASGAIEGVANFFGGERTRADAVVAPRNGLPSVPPPSLARGGVVNNDHSTTTINITQRPGEDAEAVARRVTEEQARARAARQRGVMYDPAPAF